MSMTVNGGNTSGDLSYINVSAEMQAILLELGVWARGATPMSAPCTPCAHRVHNSPIRTHAHRHIRMHVHTKALTHTHKPTHPHTR